ncbi:DUF4383 domain-containing protein [Streptomyces sp. SM14]|uniref:DUF4383 domain-containing protein n=1 Tax=Streptomyces sp. SM14 TaxID=1736045 RepID=UPI000CD52EF0|nr:DUF4383 domain-containing protein [Streptomyces sp. SM14]
MSAPSAVHGPRHARRSALHQLLHRTGTQLDEELPVDHRLSLVYRIGAGLIGTGLVVFGVLGLVRRLGVFTTADSAVLGLNTNGALSLISIFFGALLFTGMLRGGNFASTLNIVIGTLFVASGFVNLAVLETGLNVLNFRIQNVLFSFVAGMLLLVFGMYGRVAGRLPRDNPYWRARHPENAAAGREREATRLNRRELEDRAGRGTGGATPGPAVADPSTANARPEVSADVPPGGRAPGYESTATPPAAPGAARSQVATDIRDRGDDRPAGRRRWWRRFGGRHH